MRLSVCDGCKGGQICDDNNHLLTPLDFTGPSVILQGSSLNIAVTKMVEYTKKSLQETFRFTHLHGGKIRIRTLQEYNEG